MKKYALILAATLALSGTAFAGVPVTVIADVPAITNQIETMAKWKAQYDQMVSQINQMQKQYDAVTGPRGLGQIMNNPALRDYLPSDWQRSTTPSAPVATTASAAPQRQSTTPTRFSTPAGVWRPERSAPRARPQR